MGLHKNQSRKPAPTYQTYIKSTGWKTLSDTLRTWDDVCRICGDPNGLELHHIGYDSELGEEKIDELISVCGDCHEELTTLVKRRYFLHNEALEIICNKHNKKARAVIQDTRTRRMRCLIIETLQKGITGKNRRFFKQLDYLNEMPISLLDLCKIGKRL